MFANVIIDISVEKLDRTFQYRVPNSLEQEIVIGSRVVVPFGTAMRTGYVVELTDQLAFAEDKIKEIHSLDKKSVLVQDQLIALAAWMKVQYGSTMNQALKVVLPVKKVVRKTKQKVESVPISMNWKTVQLNEEQQSVVDTIWASDSAIPQLIYGITGSGKTEVYMELIERTIAIGQEAILLIPEISLTFQTISRFQMRFGNKVGFVHSKLSAGEKYECFEKAKKGELSVVIGPRSALFTPFSKLGIIIVDEEHEGAYKSEPVPKYHAREVAIKRAQMCGAKVVLGSATPSISSFYQAKKGNYQLHRLSRRAKAEAVLPQISVVDLRNELMQGNKTMFSYLLQDKIKERLEKKEQIILFLNKRGYAGFVSCRSCGSAFGCPHCAVSLNSHNNGRLVCHYCGYSIPDPKVCPSCGSPYIAGFGTGTQKVEAMIKKMYPEAKVLRMDADTTRKKSGHDQILKAFSEGKADILIGTQMIVKGHDFPKVTLVGVLAADLSLHAPDYNASERTFALLVQAAGRAGRGELPGEVVIQTYQPEHYSIVTASHQDYDQFYMEEISYRSMLGYPPVWSMVSIQFTGEDESLTERAANRVAEELKYMELFGANIIGPSAGAISKVNDTYRQVIYLKHRERDVLIKIKNTLETMKFDFGTQVLIQFDFNPESAF